MPDARAFPPNFGVVFDMDGLMLDTESIAKTCWERAFTESGHELTPDLFLSMVGRNKRDCFDLLRGTFGGGFDCVTIYARCGVLYEEHVSAHGTPLMPGVLELLGDLAALGVPLAVATSTRNPTARQRLEKAGLLPFFQTVVAGNEVAQGKPAPDIYLEAVRRLGVDAARSFALEDSHAGVRAAHAAGLKVIMVPDLLPATEEIAKLTHRVVKSLQDVRAVLDEAAARY
jgi:HAD superfamily hydrolase (TIGR01509 family)